MGKADGFGVYQWANGDRYEGEWKECQKHGHGSDKFSNGDMYVGHYRNGVPDNFGYYRWKDGTCYEGELKQGKKHGKGKWKMAVGGGLFDEYQGQFIDDKISGLGTYKWARNKKSHLSRKSSEVMELGVNSSFETKGAQI